MLSWGGGETYKPRWFAVAAFSALSLPLLFVAAPPEAEQTSTEAVKLTPAAVEPAAPVTPPAVEAPPVTAPAKPRELKTRKRAKRIVVSLPERKLAVLDQGQVVKTYPVAVGAEASPSPTGEFRITSKVTDPTYYRPGMIVTPGPANPLGSRWLGLDLEHYGIHGTNEPQSIGQAASHGCIRMANSDVEDLFALASTGDMVEISDEPLQQLAQLESLLAETDGE